MSRRKRVLLWTGLLVVLAGVGLVGVALGTAPDRRVSLDNFKKIQIGMLRQEVEQILGPPIGCGYKPQPSSDILLDLRQTHFSMASCMFWKEACYWSNGRDILGVRFNETGCVIGTGSQGAPLPTTFISRLHRGLGL